MGDHQVRVSDRASGQVGQASSRPGEQRVLPLLLATFVGVAIGASASWPLFFGALDRAEPAVDGALHLVLPALATTAALLLLVGPLTWFGVRRFLGRVQGTLSRVTMELAQTSRAMAESDTVRAVNHAEQAVLEALAWYAPVAARRFLFHSALALLVAFGGMLGTVLLFRQTLLMGAQNKMLSEQVELLKDQNEKLEQQIKLSIEQNKNVEQQIDLMKQQNRKIDLQTVTAEAQRRGPLTAELFALLSQATSIQPRNGKIKLTPVLITRIVAFSRSATPYWLVEISEVTVGEVASPEPRLTNRARSPERGILLTSLVTAGVDMSGLVQAGVVFVDSDLRNAIIENANFLGLDLSGSDFQGAILHNAKFVKSNLENTNFSNAKLKGVDATKAKFGRANLSHADLTSANLSDADLQDGHFLRPANVNNTDFTDAHLLTLWVGGVDFSTSDLSGTKVRAQFDDLPGWMKSEEFGEYVMQRRR